MSTEANENRIARNVIRQLAEREGVDDLTRSEIDSWTSAALGWTFDFAGEEDYSEDDLIDAAVERLEAESISIAFWRSLEAQGIAV